MSNFNRRDALRLGALGLATGGFVTAIGRPFRAQQPLPADDDIVPAPVPKKMLTIFLRGGNDGVNALIPDGDPQYAAIRPTIAIPTSQSTFLNGFARLHPALGALNELWNNGDIAMAHRIGYANQSRSHFSGQQFWETAKPGDLAFEEGYVTRLVDATVAPSNAFPAASVSGALQRLYLSRNPDLVLAHVPRVSTYTLGTGQAEAKLRGSDPTTTPPNGAGLSGAFHRAPDAKGFDDLLRANGRVMLGSETVVSALGPYTPQNGATYPQNAADAAAAGLPQTGFTYTFMRQVQDAVQLLKQTSCQIAGVELGGWDTHSAQGAATGRQADRMLVLAHAMRSVYRDTTAPLGLGNRMLTMVMSEFGRTSIENGSFGTDHAKASVMWVAGTAVNGAVYNCDTADGTWIVNQTLLSDSNKYIAHLTDYRAVKAEVFQRHLGATAAELDGIIPGWAGLSGPEFTYLGIL